MKSTWTKVLGLYGNKNNKIKFEFQASVTLDWDEPKFISPNNFPVGSLSAYQI
jgi:hypothetical protein